MNPNPLQVMQALNVEGRKWFTVEPVAATDPDAPSTARIRLYDAIGYGWFGVTAKDFVAELDGLDVEQIDLHINSPGGLCSEAIAIKNALVQHPAKVTAYVDGMAASAATVVAMGADEVVMMPDSEMMIHDAWMVCVGPAADMHSAGDRLDQVSNNIAAMYARKAGGTRDEWRSIMSDADETWYSADEAVAAGLADRVDGEADPQESAAAKARFADAAAALFQHPGRAAAPAPAALAGHSSPVASAAGSRSQGAAASGDTTQEGAAMSRLTDEQTTSLAQRLGVPEDADGATILDALDEALQERAEPARTQDSTEGIVALDQETYQQLRADATAGREARREQQQQRRSALVSAAVKDGRIAPARAQHWITALEADPEGAEASLDRLQKGLIPVDEVGHDTFDDAEGKPADLYSQVFPESMSKED